MFRNILVVPFIIAITVVSVIAGTDPKIHVKPFTVAGRSDGENLKGAFQAMLATRLGAEGLMTVDSPAGADVVIDGSYAAFGGSFSLDLTARDAAGAVIGRAFQEGKGDETLISAMGEAAKKLGQVLSKKVKGAAEPGSSAAGAVPGASAIAKPESELIRPVETEKQGARGWRSKGLPGGIRTISLGLAAEGLCRGLVMADVHSIYAYQLGAALEEIASTTLSADEQIMAVDTADLDGDGKSEIYVTVMKGENLSSQVWQLQGRSLQRIAERLPYFFRAISLSGGARKVYAQKMGLAADFHGEVFEVAKEGNSFYTRNPFKLPRFGYLYNFNTFTDAGGASYFVIMHPDGYLLVYSAAGEELWRSNEKFGGSEVYFKREDTEGMRITGDPYRWIYLEQRITVAKNGEIIVPQNSGDSSLGKGRSYKKSTVFSFAWNGTMLDEQWRLREMPNYLVDLQLDESQRELLILHLAQRGAFMKKGNTILSIRNIE